MNKLELFLKKEWQSDEKLLNFYDDFDDYKNYMVESIEQYKELQKEIEQYKGTLEEFIETLEFGYNNYEENKYVDFCYGNLTVTVIVKDNKLILSNFIEIWNDRYNALLNAPFDINEYLNLM